jgi:hypothetical protein
MTTALNVLKGQLKLNLKLSAIANEGMKMGSSKDKKKKNNKNTFNWHEKKKDEAWKKEPSKGSEKREKKVGKYTYHWCEHHMAWTIHSLPTAYKEEQKKKPQKANSATFAAAAAMAVNPQFAALMASIANLEEWWCVPARMWTFTMVAFMAGPTMDSGHQIAYLQLFIMPNLLQLLCQATSPADLRLRKTTYNAFVQGSSWYCTLQGRQTHSIPKRLHGKKKPSVRIRTEVNDGKSKLWTHLVPITVPLFKVGCHIKGQVRKIVTYCWLRGLSSITAPTYTALSSAVNRILAIRFDSDSYPIGIDTHALHSMVNAPHLFKDLKLGEVGEVEGIKLGLDIKGTGTFKFKIEDNNGMTHKIKIPNSLYVEWRGCNSKLGVP